MIQVGTAGNERSTDAFLAAIERVREGHKGRREVSKDSA
jgi:hypothetical protein